MRLIEGLSHLEIATPDPDATARDYARLLQTAPVAPSDAGCAHWFDTANLAVLLRRPHAGEATGLAGMAFRVAALDRACSEAARCGLPLAAPSTPAWSDGWRETAVDRAATHGVAIALTDRPPSGRGSGVGLDHVVIRTPAPERAVALYGGRLGLDMRLDRSNAAWGARLLFFRCGDLVVEIAHTLSGGVSDAPDAFGGLSWRMPDLDAAHAAFARDGVAVSELRTGRRPGSRVFTVRERTADVPTILLGVTPRAA